MRNINDEINVGIIGLGYVGLTLGVALALRGIKVFGVDINEKVIMALNSGKAHFVEEGIDEHLSKVLNKKFFLVDNLPEETLDAVLITVGTPINEDKELNFQNIVDALNQIPKINNKDFLVGLRSTVAVGTSTNIILPELNKRQIECELIFCPERTIEGDAINELFTLPQIIGGTSSKGVDLGAEIFSKLTEKIIKVSTIEAAELVKLFNNTYRDINFALGNYFNLVAQSFGVDGYEVINASNKDYKRGGIPMPGFVGGPCLEKDPYILASDNFRQSNIANLLEHNFTILGRSFNECLPKTVVDYLVNKSEKKKVLVSGLAFKGRPATSDMRGSTSVEIINLLLENGFELGLHDFETSDEEIRYFYNDLKIENDFSSNEYETLLVCNNHKNYSLLGTSELENFSLIFDSWKSINPNLTIKSKIINLGTMYL
ncbi:nucleotide sugar dehydrogenase [Gammaproteobacteria bacterium]|nr:nucleotide sugar dehydrogenase [Gammaproteobacteria bacterium]